MAASSTPAVGAISISGDATVTPGNPFDQAQIGYQSLGTLRIDSGSTLTSGLSQMGINQSGIGLATVTGTGSQWNITNAAEVGVSGVGRLDIVDGAVVNLSQSGSLRIGANPPSHGTVVVDGLGTILQIGSQLLVGAGGGSASLQIANAAIVSALNSTTQIGAQGRIELNGGLLRASQITSSGVIAGTGEVSTPSFGGITSSGRIEAGPAQQLRVTGTGNFQNQGTIAADGGQIEIQRLVTNAAGGPNVPEITLRNALLRVGSSETSGPQLMNSGILAAIGGLNDFYGRITNSGSGQIAVTNQSVMVFHDDVTADSGTIVVFPGSSAVFLEDLTMSDDSVLLADLAGTGADTGFGDIEVVGTAQLSGSLQVTLAEGFTPQEGDMFTLLAASQITGALSLGDVPQLAPGLKWDLDTEENLVTLSVVPGLAGDYNGDGSVDTADYVVWRATLGQSGPDLPADGNSDNDVDDEDYQFWLNHFGNSLAGEAASGAAVPEPASMVWFFVGMLLVVGNRRVLH